MYPTEPQEQDVLFTANRLFQDALDKVDEAARPCTGTGRAEFSVKHLREAALHRNGRLRAIQALHRPGK